MNKIWAPWRKAYIRPDKRRKRGCIFCQFAAGPPQDAGHYILKTTPFNFAILNLYPYNNGHTMIVPRRHVRHIAQMREEERLDWLALYEEVRRAIEKTMRPEGFNVGMNFGRAAGAGIPNHLHLHVVPRWHGDTNFMPVAADTKVISESLASVQTLLTRVLSSNSK